MKTTDIKTILMNKHKRGLNYSKTQFVDNNKHIYQISDKNGIRNQCSYMWTADLTYPTILAMYRMTRLLY